MNSRDVQGERMSHFLRRNKIAQYGEFAVGGLIGGLYAPIFGVLAVDAFIRMKDDTGEGRGIIGHVVDIARGIKRSRTARV